MTSRREHPLVTAFRLSPDELERIDRGAAAAGFTSRSDYLRSRVFGDGCPVALCSCSMGAVPLCPTYQGRS